MPTSDQSVTQKRKRNTYLCMNREVTAFLTQRKIEDLCLFWRSIFQSGVFLSASNNSPSCMT